MELIEVNDRFDIPKVYDKYVQLVCFYNRLIITLFGDDYAERVSPDQLTDEKLLEAVRMLKEVY